ncbi:MAG TPA: glycoside hydrolase family 172 protein [Armatimonadota bacterium]|nr:glycoside hydrolase family 172 protein [Armatimonadota bacterium]
MTVLPYGLFDIARLSSGKTRSISAENPEGKVGAGAQAVPDENNPASMLGKGWKARPCITLPKNSNTVLADIKGPGTIRHIWITVDPKAYRDCILRLFWDGEATPSVEAPLGDFFANGHALRVNVNSIPIAVNPTGGFNSYWPMPFRKGARIEVESQSREDVGGFFYQITYELDEVPNDAAYFHAQWRRSVTPIGEPQHTILEGVKGKGHYVGTYLAWTQLANGWWGEGEIKFFIDGDKEYPTICGTGTEDYFGGAWGFGDTFSTAFLGYPLWRKVEGEVPKHGLYRWHILDPIRFESALKVTIQALGWWPFGKFQPLQDDIASVGYWYQTEPHARFPEMLPAHLRWPR